MTVIEAERVREKIERGKRMIEDDQRAIEAAREERTRQRAIMKRAELGLREARRVLRKVAKA